jgi:predicted DNA-binding protein with PD1-like motif
MKSIHALLLAVVLAGCSSIAVPPRCSPLHDGCAVRTYAIRLKPGEDLRGALEAFVRERHLRAAFVQTCVGSLNTVTIRFANQPNETLLTGPFEIVSLVGTFSVDGPHLHISVSDAQGKTLGGHLAAGSSIYTTAEVVIGEIAGTTFKRETDPVTTWKELVVE